MHDVGRNERGVAGAEDAFLAINPLLDLSGDNEDHLFLIGVLVEIVALAGSEADIDHGELACTSGGRIAEPAQRAPVLDLVLDFFRDDEFSRHWPLPASACVLLLACDFLPPTASAAAGMRMSRVNLHRQVRQPLSLAVVRDQVRILMPCPVEARVAKEPYVDHHGDSSR